MTHPAGEKAQAVRIARKLGVREAARQTGIDMGLLSRWMTTGSEETMALELVDTVEAARRQQMMDEATLVTEKSVHAASLFLDSAMATADPGDALKWTTAAEKLISIVASVTAAAPQPAKSWRDHVRREDPDPIDIDAVDLEELFT